MLKTVAFIGSAILAVSLVGSAGLAQEVTAKHGQANINWTTKTIQATGSGAPSLKAANVAVARLGAERAAKMDAFRNILEAVKGVKISGTGTVGEAMTGETKAKVEGVVRNFKVLDTKYYSDGGVDLIVEVPLDGVTAAAVDAGTSVSKGEATDVTGVVINAKGLKLSPALAPRILDESGKEIYGPSKVKKDVVAERGIASYSKSLNKAKTDNRVAGKPVIVKGVKAAAKGSADVVVSSADAATLTKLASVLAEGRVVIVTD